MGDGENEKWNIHTPTLINTPVIPSSANTRSGAALGFCSSLGQITARPGLLLLLCKVGEINHHHPTNLGECLLSVSLFIRIFCFDPHSNLKEIFLSSPFYR